MQGKPVQLTVGLFAVLAFNASAATLCVDLNSTNPVPPYANWSMAATNIQDAVDAASPGDLIVVADGVYQTGGRVVSGALTNRVVIDKAIRVESLNGPASTVIQGFQTAGTITGDSSVRCVYLTTNASLIGFTLTNGATLRAYQGENSDNVARWCSGGGAWCADSSAAISNCVLAGNSADVTFYGMGGGAFGGTLSRCVLAGNQACNGGGAYGSTLSDCTLKSNAAFYNGSSVVDIYGGGAYNCNLTNCTLSGNSAKGLGGGAALGSLSHCRVENNVASGGGGAYVSTVVASTLSGNSAFGQGGGAYYGTLADCTLSGNSALQGGGASRALLNNCVVFENLALDAGGGVNSSTLNACALFCNSALTNGGGVYGGGLNNCTLVANAAPAGGGAASASLSNSIIYFNQALAGTNHSSCTLNYCCTVPLPSEGAANISTDPQLTDVAHLSPASPCLGAGDPAAASGLDLDGEPWANPPAIGCDESVASAAVGPLGITVRSDYSNAKLGARLRFTAQVTGHAGASAWDFGDGTVVSNQPCSTHAWAAPGKYSVVFSAYNQTYPGGVSATAVVHVAAQPIQYVTQASANPVAPFTSWATAATNIQDALDAAFAGGGTLLVSNGVYRTGGRTVTGILTNRVAITQPMVVQSVNGPEVTVIEGLQVPGTMNGDGAVRCAWLADGAMLIGFTLTNGATRALIGPPGFENSGGGAWCESTNAVLANCVLAGNSCFWWGAGVYSGTLTNCQIIANTNQNTCLAGGGGAAFSRLLDCSLIGNKVLINEGGGAFSCTLSNCLVAGNAGGGTAQSTLDSCLVTGNYGSGLYKDLANNCTVCSNVLASSQGGGGAAEATLSNCVLYANQATLGAGAYNCLLTFCTVSNNWATRSGGGVYFDKTLTNALNRCTVTGNVAADSGGGLYINNQPRLFLTYTTFSGNSATNNGGGAALSGSSGVAFGNCIFTGNSAGASGGGLYSGNSGLAGGAANCSFYGNSAGASGGGVYYTSLTNCTLATNAALLSGGGVYGSPLQKCLLVGNRAGNGGGAYTASPSACTFLGNSAATNGGGAYLSILRNCLVLTNNAESGGGIYQGGAYNSTIVANSASTSGGGIALAQNVCNTILYYNTAPIAPNYNGGSLNACCTLPLPPPPGTGNITSAPLFIDFAAGNFRLQTNSPCINTGNNSYVQPGTLADLDGRPRIVGGKVDLGAYEFQGSGVGEFVAWLLQFGLPTDGSADLADTDRDGMNNWQEWRARTDPTSAVSALIMQTPLPTVPNLTLCWQTVPGVTYYLQRATDLAAQPAFSTIQSNLTAQGGFLTYRDTNAPASGPVFYRVGVQ